MTAPYEIIVGLEVHVQLLTQSKLFCGCSTRFGAPPNTQTCPVCLGLPGALPVMNRRALELALRTAVALECTIAPFTKWDRKNYYYPDLPKGYQISQYDLPFSTGGHLLLYDPKGQVEPRPVGIIRVHLEEDTGKSMHDEDAGAADSRIDLNRAGTPLLEIVTQPDLRSPAEAKAFLSELKLLVEYLGVSDCNMQEGSLRVDANVNLHVDQRGQRVPTPIVEVKNMNSFRAVERALAHEAQRQYAQWQETQERLGDVPKQTRGWDEAANATIPQRHKEESSDYRYFPDPDLPPVTVGAPEVEALRTALPRLPAELRRALEREHRLSAYDSDVLVSQGPATVDYFLELAQLAGDSKLACNWIQQDVLRLLKERELSIEAFGVRPPALAALLGKVRGGELDAGRARELLPAMLDQGRSADELIAERGIQAVDESQLEALCRELLAANPKILADLKQGIEKAAGALVGQAKKRNPNVNPARVREICVYLAREL